MTTESQDTEDEPSGGTCGECEIAVYDVSYSGKDGSGYLNPKRCPLCGGHLK